MPLAYPFGAGQPLGCNICGPAAEVSLFATGTTASVGPFDVLTNRSPSAQGVRNCEEPTGPAFGRPDDKLRDEAIQTFVPERWIASLRSQ
jgi:hypothetical protein